MSLSDQWSEFDLFGLLLWWLWQNSLKYTLIKFNSCNFVLRVTTLISAHWGQLKSGLKSQWPLTLSLGLCELLKHFQEELRQLPEICKDIHLCFIKLQYKGILHLGIYVAVFQGEKALKGFYCHLVNKWSTCYIFIPAVKTCHFTTFRFYFNILRLVTRIQHTCWFYLFIYFYTGLSATERSLLKVQPSMYQEIWEEATLLNVNLFLYIN